MMMCPECGSKLKLTYYHDIEASYPICHRTRKCTKCNYTIKTVELPLDKYEKDDKLAKGIARLIEEIY